MDLYRLTVKLTKQHHYTFYVDVYPVIKQTNKHYYLVINNQVTSLDKNKIGQLKKAQVLNPMGYIVWLTQAQYVNSNYGAEYIEKGLTFAKQQIRQKQQQLFQLEKDLNHFSNMIILKKNHNDIIDRK